MRAVNGGFGLNVEVATSIAIGVGSEVSNGRLLSP